MSVLPSLEKDLLTKITDHKRVSEEPALGPAFSYRSVIILNILQVVVASMRY